MWKLKQIIETNRLLSKAWSWYIYVKLALGLNKDLDTEINSYIKDYVPVNDKNNKCYICRLKFDILYSRKFFLITTKEYFAYQFEKKNDLGRMEFVGQLQLHRFWEKFNLDSTHLIFHNKEENYIVFKEYYNRKIVKIDSIEDREKFDSFATDYKSFVAKPIADNQGHGVRVIDENSDLDAIFREYIGLPGGAVLEELIVESKEMAKFHPASVNTIRFVTFYNRGILNKILAVIRMGRNGSCIDNACAGGIYATIDMETGIIDSPATSHRLERFFTHPDTGVQILGAQIPKWKELNELVEKVVKVVPEQKQVGWDFALTDRGWIIVEGNARPMIQYFVHNRGLRKEMQCMYDAYNEQ